MVDNFSKVLKRKQVLKDIELKISKGECIGIKGINGSGKTMLLRAISGLITPTAGKVIVANKSIRKDVMFPESMGLLIEYPTFTGAYTGFQNLIFLSDIKKLISHEEVKEMLTKVGLSPNDDRKFSKYSLGMKQRLGIAQAIMEKPDLIILDEPTNALDKEATTMVQEILRAEKDRGATLIIATHDDRLFDGQLFDRVVQMNDGRIIEINEKE